MTIDQLMERLEEHPSDWPVRLYSDTPKPQAWRVAGVAVQREPAAAVWLLLARAELPTGVPDVDAHRGEPS
jgi:hypothetical protein